MLTRVAVRRRPARRGAILLIVLTMLALFAVVGLSFVLYSESEATAARIHKMSRTVPSDDAPPDSTPYANAVLGQILFPVGDTGDATLSGFRGHDQTTMVYGNRPGDLNYIPYNGIGGFNETVGLPSGGLSRMQIINYSWQFDRTTPANSRVVDPEHVSTTPRDQTAVAAPIAGTVPYIGKNAAYTYPDRNNAFLAIVNPNTGEVVIPSFHRPSVFGTLASTNANWTNAQGRYMLIRPRPQDHSAEFPLPTPNPDGSITGDVQNLIYANGRQKNDSVWIDANLPVIRWRGKLIKPLVAPLILPLDGRVNLNVAGNRNGGSNQGFGPWEINPAMILSPDGTTPGTANMNAVFDARYGGATPTINGSPALNIRMFQPDAGNFNDATKQTAPPDYAKIDFDGVGATGPLTLPTGVNTVPTYPIPGYENAGGTEPTNHPAIWNPFQWSQNPIPAGPRAFPVADLRQMSGRYSDRSSKYGVPILGQGTFAPIFGPTAPAGSGPFQATTAGDTNRLAALRRALTTTISNSVSRAGLAPNFGLGGTQQFQMAGPNVPPALTGLPQFLSGSAGAWTLPDGAPNSARSLWAGFGSLDMNRPLVDYRDLNPPFRPAAITPATPWALNDTTVTAASYNAARVDRQQFARDIFARLILATGAGATVTFDATGYPIITLNAGVATGTPQFDALRWLAQLSANIVDQIDNDDVSTAFVWNPITPGTAATEVADAANYGITGAAPTINDHTVFGVEQPRLVLNEIYAEAANSQVDRTVTSATAAFQVRFFIELLNPGSAISDPSNPLYFSNAAPGAVPLRFGGAGGISCYKIDVYKRQGTNVRTSLTGPTSSANVAGIPLPGTPADLSMDFLDVTAPAGAPANIADRVEPNNGNYAAAGANRNGFAVIGPELDPAQTDNVAFVPNTGAGQPFNNMLRKPTPAAASTNKLQYDTPQNRETEWEDPAAVPPANSYNHVRENGHAVVLRRLACPYRPEAADNPYITVDYMSRVPVRDAVRVTVESAATLADGVRMPAVTPTGFRSIGRVQPFAGDETTDPDTATLADGLTIRQQPAPALPAQQHTFFQHNGVTATTPAGTDLTLALPFQWMTHLDRKLVNATELLHTATVPPHQLTHRFAIPNGAGGPGFQRHDLQHAIPVGADPAGALFTAQSPLYRMFEGLSVKPWGYGLPIGGRVPGKVNINMLWDQDPTTNRSQVFDALFLANGAVPAGNGFLTTDLDAIWGSIKSTRSNAWSLLPAGSPPVISSSIHETGAPTDDRPFRSLGSPMFAPGANLLTDLDIRDTILRPKTPGGLSLFQRVDAGNTLHPYQSWEPLRKAFNNLTTTTDCYMVVFTIGYFEVRNTGPFSVTNVPQLGKEVYNIVPGDMRAKYTGVIDRTQIGVDNAGTQTGPSWFADLAEAAPVGTTSIRFPAPYLDGVLQAPTAIRLGTGDAGSGYGDGEWRTVSATSVDAATGLMTATIDATTRAHPVGTPVSNIFLRNPGPQANFNVQDPKYKGVLPFFTKVEPTLP